MESKISAVIITHNVERTLERCLQSLEGIADEIIVVDQFSTDRTTEICAQYNVQVISSEWLGYGPQKNKGIAATRFSYILSFDADEAADETLRQSLLQVKRAGLQGVYRFTRLNFYYGKFLRHGLEYPDYKIRLFPKDIVSWNDDLVHEHYVFKETLNTTTLKGHLLHYTYSSIHDQIQKTNRYTTLGAELYYNRGKRSSLIKIVFSPIVTFIQAYFFKLGFLDGLHGFIMAKHNAYNSFVRYIKLWEYERNKATAEVAASDNKLPQH